MEATLRAIAEKGYHLVSLLDIARTAGVSRGAITHHYVNKQELTAAAIRYFVDWRNSELVDAVNDCACSSFACRLNVMWDWFQRIFPITLEVVTALRSDVELRRLVDRGGAGTYEKITSGYAEFFSEETGLELPHNVIVMVTAFYRGLYFESLTGSREEILAVKAEFDAVLEQVMKQQKVSADAIDALQAVPYNQGPPNGGDWQ
ncbi:TetR/AcrR family transcriptional regulator [Hyphomonas sp. WL0036]|uniref:TetR/AcrR family transcriptional regulator n=1 Tax=Hyphomonas sediminis TaxID=2866160 RepID=UPI001C7F34F4|nr:TetR/AcrR family transcriptional regulator [Hyphomonas sediminis]MBY9067263.1 TetR/AcrR family transcriptional regulator [Hyphomonas sediminis]